LDENAKETIGIGSWKNPGCLRELLRFAAFKFFRTRKSRRFTTNQKTERRFLRKVAKQKFAFFKTAEGE